MNGSWEEQSSRQIRCRAGNAAIDLGGFRAETDAQRKRDIFEHRHVSRVGTDSNTVRAPGESVRSRSQEAE